MIFIISIGIVIVVITCLSIEVKLGKVTKQNKEILESLKREKETKKW